MTGYIGRSLLNKNPWDQPAFELQICTIIIAPTFICASIYLTLKHVALALNPSMSRIAPQWYPRIFLPADVSCLILQAIGGGVAASAGATDRTVLRVGNDIIIAGIVLQVVVLAVFGLLAGDYYLRVRRWFASGEASSSPAALAVWNDAKFRKFAAGIAAAYSAVLIRCIYRYVQLS